MSAKVSEQEHVPQVPKLSIRDRGESLKGRDSPSDAQPVKSDPEVAIFPPLFDDASILSPNPGHPQLPDIGLISYAGSNASNEMLFEGVLDTGSAECVVGGTVVSRFGLDHIDWQEKDEGSNEESKEMEERSKNKPTEATEARLNTAKTWAESRFDTGDTDIRSSASGLDTIISPAAPADAEYPWDPNSDRESIEGSVFSERTEDTMATTSTDFSDFSEEVTATEQYLQFIAYDDLLRPSFEEAQEQSRLSAEVLEAKMRVLLKKFARELRSEAQSEIQRKAFPFLSQRAGFVARGLRVLYWQDGASELDLGQRNASEARVVAQDNEEDDEVSNARRGDGDLQILFSHVKQFLLSSGAFAKLRETVRRLLKPERPSWAAVRDQWERELQFDLPPDVQLDCSIKIISKDDITWADRFKSALEAYSGEEWLWELFKAPRRPVPEGKIRLQWQSVSVFALGQAQY